jgi:hypothetical protein
MLIEGYNIQLCGVMPTDLRMGVPALTTNFPCLSGTFIKTQRKAEISSPYQACQDARTLEEWLQMQPQRFFMHGISADSYDDAV